MFDNNIDTRYDSENPLYRSPAYTVADRSVRGASVMASKALDSFGVEMSMRKDVFDNVVRFTEKVGLENLSAEVRRYVEKRVRDGKRNGSIKKI